MAFFSSHAEPIPSTASTAANVKTDIADCVACSSLYHQVKVYSNECMKNLWIVLAIGANLLAQNNSEPNPYRTIENWAKLPDGQIVGLDQRRRYRSRRQDRMGRGTMRGE